MQKITALFLGAIVLVSLPLTAQPAFAVCSGQDVTIGTLRSVSTQNGRSQISLDNTYSFDTSTFSHDKTNIDAYNALAKVYAQNNDQLPKAYQGSPPIFESDVIVESAAIAAVSYQKGDIVVVGPPGGGSCVFDGFTGFFATDGTIRYAIADDSQYLPYTYGSQTLTLSPGTGYSCAAAPNVGGTSCNIPMTYTVAGNSVTLKPGDTKALAASSGFSSISLIDSTNITFPPSDAYQVIEDFYPKNLYQVISFNGATSSPPSVQPVSPTSTTASCPVLQHTLARGSQNNDVVTLQNFLISQGTLASGFATGYFGLLTQQAVQSWQSRQGVVSAGSPSTTGYGAVGPKTRTAINQACGSAPQGGTSPTGIQTPTTNVFTAIPTSGSAPLTVSFSTTYTYPESYAGSTGLSINFGDGTAGSIVAGNTVQHTYSSPGTFTAKVLGCSLNTDLYCAPAAPLGTATVTVTGQVPATVGTTPISVTVPPVTMSTPPPSSTTTSSVQITSINPSCPVGQSLLYGNCVIPSAPVSSTSIPIVSPSVSTPTKSYPTLPNPSQTLAVAGYDIYSPDPVIVNGSPRLYFGGWLSTSDLPHDGIFAADCGYGGACTNPRKVIDAVASGLYQVNDPSVVLIPASGSTPAYYIMYMTGDTDATLASNGIYYATSWATDGITWSKPALLMSGYWLPSATIKNGDVQLYANSTTDGRVARFDLGTSGKQVGGPSYVSFDNAGSVPPYYSNVDVVWRPSLNLYQILAERELSATAGASSVIDYLTSTDGISWHLVYPSIISPTQGQYRVGTPAQWPDSALWVYFGSTAQQDSTGFKINFAQWNPPAGS